MAHPHHEHRQHRVEKSRVHHITRGYATGGAVHDDEVADEKLVRKMVKRTALKVDGKKGKHRLDRPGRKRGGRVAKGKGTHVNVIVAPQGAPHPMAPMPVHPGIAATPPGSPPVPPAAPMPHPVAAPPVMPPGAGAPMMPPRRSGGRAYAKGGAVKSGPAWKEGKRLGTPVQHADGKDDQKDIGRGRPVTYATGGAVEAPKGRKGMAPHLDGGGRGGIARLEKIRRAKREYA